MATISFVYTYAENKFDVFTDGTADYSGNWAPRSPEHRFNARLALTPMAGLTVELEMDEVSTQYHDEANLFEYSRPTLFNLRSTYDWREWSCWVHVKNLTDRQYATYVGTDNDEPSYYSGEPLAVFAGVSHSWGK
jgi:outer membrane receptor protein involved in Fe transport